MMKILNDVAFSIQTDEVLRRAHLTDADDDIAQEVHKLVETSRQLARPKAVYQVGYVENKSEESLEIAGIKFTSRVLRVNLDQVERVFAYVATCGTELDEIYAPTTDMLLSYCVDIIKEMALHAALAHLAQHLETKYALGQTASMNPGSLADWPITQQKELFAIFGDVEQLVGVRLTASCLMIPTKSVSGIIFPTEIKFESCQLCSREHCPNRRARYDPQLVRAYGIPAQG